MNDKSNKISVHVRIKPTNTLNSLININNNECTINNKTYSFERVYFNESQYEIFDNIKFVLNEFLDNKNASIIVYGQTGSGKTFTLFNRDNSMLKNNLLIENNFGLIFNSLFYLFNNTNNLTISSIEIYNENIYDLFNNNKLILRQSNDKLILNLNEITVNSYDKAIEYLDIALNNRTVQSTKMNANSSRSHIIINIIHNDCKLSFIDLAGSERFNDNNLRTTVSINSGLLALGNVINALYKKTKNKNTYVPYRDSKLTRILESVLNSNVLIIGCINIDYVLESVNTLNFCARASNVYLEKEVIKSDNKNLEVIRLKKEIMYLKEEIKKLKGVNFNKPNIKIGLKQIRKPINHLNFENDSDCLTSNLTNLNLIENKNVKKVRFMSLDSSSLIENGLKLIKSIKVTHTIISIFRNNIIYLNNNLYSIDHRILIGNVDKFFVYNNSIIYSHLNILKEYNLTINVLYAFEYDISSIYRNKDIIVIGHVNGNISLKQYNKYFSIKVSNECVTNLLIVDNFVYFTIQNNLLRLNLFTRSIDKVFLISHNGKINKISLLNQNIIITCSSDLSIKLFNTKSSFNTIPYIHKHNILDVNGIKLNNKLIVVSLDIKGCMKVFNYNNLDLSCIYKTYLKETVSDVCSINFNKNNLIVSFASEIFIYDLIKLVN
ncbi:KINH [Hepatospora eriocheir]|uniref:KINH n=1 Tax=Hepatospora eriocheir TaxID=1081669 RepID=A0A1X0QDZ5_9MICR|nr:KINH [Hepatospora eriocheir]